MFEGISNAVKTATPVFSVGCYTAAGLIAGRKVCLGVGCKVASTVAGILNEETAGEWNRIGNKYLAMAKKDAAQDLTKAAALVAAGIAVDYADDYIFPEPVVVKGWVDNARDFGSDWVMKPSSKAWGVVTENASYYGNQIVGYSPKAAYVSELANNYLVQPGKDYVVVPVYTTVKDQLPSVTALLSGRFIFPCNGNSILTAITWVAGNLLYKQL